MKDGRLRARVLVAMLLGVGVGFARGQESRPASAVTTHDDIVIVRDVVYARPRDDVGREVTLRLDAAFPKRSGTTTLPAVLYVHGGRWASGAKTDGEAGITVLARGGYFAATIDYRLAGEAKYPAAVHDVKAAVRFIRANAADLGVDPDRIGIWGHSAGGHLSAFVATSANEPRLEGEVGVVGIGSHVRCAVSVSGPADLDRPDFSPPARAIIAGWLGELPEDAASERAREASPITHVDAADPPILLVHGTDDPLVPFEQARMFHARLERAGIDATLHPVAGAGHHVADDDAARRIAAFFDEHLGGHAVEQLR